MKSNKLILFLSASLLAILLAFTKTGAYDGSQRFLIYGTSSLLSFITLWTLVFKTNAIPSLLRLCRSSLLLGSILTVIFTFTTYGIISTVVRALLLNYDVSHALELDVKTVSFILLLMAHTALFFATMERVHAAFSFDEIALSHKLLYWFSPIAAASLVCYSFYGLHSCVILSLFSIIFLFSYDIYREQEVKTLSFFIWWLLIGAAFIAFVAHHPSKEILRDHYTNALKGDMYAPQNEEIGKIKIYRDSLQKLNIAGLIFDSDKQIALDKNDVSDFIRSKYDLASPLSLEDISIVSADSAFAPINAKPYDLNSFVESETSGIYWRPVAPHIYIDLGDTVGNQIKIFINNSTYTPSEKAAYEVTKNDDIIYRKAALDSKLYSSAGIDIADPYYLKIYYIEKGFIGPISLFTVIFALSIFIFLFAIFFNDKFRFFSEHNYFKLNDRASLRFRIQLTIVSLSMFSFIVIGIITSLYLNKLAKQENSLKARSSLNLLKNYLDDELTNNDDDDALKNYVISRSDHISDLFYGHVAIYDSKGTQLHGIKIDGVSDQIASLRANSAAQSFTNAAHILTDRLIAIHGKSGQPCLYMHYSYQAGGTDALAYVSNYIGTMLNVYIFLFLLATAIAIAISNSVTNPLQILKENLRKFKLGKTHTKLSWNRQDEIGTLISEYNKLTDEITKSAEIIARTEREMAWREMAKQVAHEIKNPLTPMKLSLQYLERAVQSDPETAQRMIAKISSTLMEQINNLTQIADSFSNFATLPKTTNEKLIINEIVEAIHDLFRKREDITFNMIEPMNELYVFADRNHLVRILNNIVKNAIQAIPEDRKGHIEIELSTVNTNALIRVSDNGIGISEPMKAKVFTPNFTTKSSGTGLGLAISANMLESMNGKIYFDSTLGKGTDFYIELPLIKDKDQVDEENLILDDAEPFSI